MYIDIHVILPNQIFDIKYLPKKKYYIIWCHPHYYQSYNYNKKKIILHHATMLYYYNYLKKYNYNVSYYEFNEKIKLSDYTIINPLDDIDLPGNPTILETPSFLLSSKDHIEYNNKSKSYFFYPFFNFLKKKINFLEDIPSKDKENRNPYKEDIKINKLPKLSNVDLYYIDKGKIFVNKYFNNNLGNIDNFIYPITHKTANKFLNHFIKNNLKYFGKYQDAIYTNNEFLFHSILSSSINIGLIIPSNIINIIKKIKNKFHINNIEAYIRQLGWREYTFYTYKYVDFDKNYFNNNKKLNNSFYNASTNLLPIDDSIQKAINSGYSHHIVRLMILGNYMTLYGLKPSEMFKWFMEVYIDSYLWVMKLNIEMASFATDGICTRRPYISSSNYISKMSNYDNENKWKEKFDNLYYSFIKKNKKKLYKYRYYIKIL